MNIFVSVLLVFSGNNVRVKMSKEGRLREEIVNVASQLFSRGYTHGSTGNISAVIDDCLLLTPTGSSFGSLDPARISKVDAHGNLISGDQPTKEQFMHHAIYSGRKSAGAVIHLHSTHSVALSCLPCINEFDALPKLTPYSHMLCGCVAMLPYFRPGDKNMANALHEISRNHWSIILAHHGPVVAGQDLYKAMYAAEELEQTARLTLLLEMSKVNTLEPQHISDLENYFPPWK